MVKRNTQDARAGMPPRQRILETAHRLFYREGIRATGIDTIIAEAGVTKVTFYRQFPSKDALIEAFLESRHDRWMSAFRERLARFVDAQSARERQMSPLEPVLQAAHEIVHAQTFRGCAFANTVAEVGPSLPSVLGIATRHKQEVCDAIMALLPARKDAERIAWAATIALDGAIVNAQRGGHSAAAALTGLRTILTTLGATTQR